MAKDRLTPCKFYVCEGNCAKGREGTFNVYCKRCNKYQARCNEHHVNRKKFELDKIRKKEAKELFKEI